MKVLILLFSLALAAISITCTGILEPNTAPYNKMAISANIDNNRHIVVVDCNDRSNYEIISPLEHSAWDPVYSPDKRYILYGDSKYTTDAGYHFKLYDTHTGEIKDWPSLYFPPPAKLTGQYYVWDLESRGFYFSETFHSIPINIKYLDINTNVVTAIADNYFSAPMAIKDSETLIVLSMKEAEPGKAGYYYMNMSGEFLGPVENPLLRIEWSEEQGRNVRGVYEIEYHAYRDLFVFALKDSSVSGTAICATNSDGSYFEVLTQGYSDAEPTYNPIDNEIYFERREWTGSDWVHYPIMRINVDSKRIDEFFKTSWIIGATDIESPNF